MKLIKPGHGTREVVLIWFKIKILRLILYLVKDYGWSLISQDLELKLLLKLGWKTMNKNLAVKQELELYLTYNIPI